MSHSTNSQPVKTYINLNLTLIKKRGYTNLYTVPFSFITLSSFYFISNSLWKFWLLNQFNFPSPFNEFILFFCGPFNFQLIKRKRFRYDVEDWFFYPMSICRNQRRRIQFSLIILCFNFLNNQPFSNFIRSFYIPNHSVMKITN